ncbi:hypothetical protein BFP70_19825 [Thioclava sp. SK-1]|nr:hypothetical protein BFP70_19825 [Thioclava sp. SK-1]
MMLRIDAVYMAATDRNARPKQSSCQGAIHTWSEGMPDPMKFQFIAGYRGDLSRARLYRRMQVSDAWPACVVR